MARLRTLASLFACLTPLLTPAQAPATHTSDTPAAAVNKARALYYTPVDQGLQSFHCDVTFNWKDFLQKATNGPVPDNDPRLAYLQTIQLSVDDDLRGAGQLHWNAPTTAPDSSEDSINKMRDSMQQLWASFFQSWNGFMTGDLVTLDSKATVDQAPNGDLHVAVRTGASLAEETFSPALTLQNIHITTPTLDGNTNPGFTPGPHGLLLTTLDGSYRQPPSAPPNQTRMKITYTPVGAFQLPSELTIAIGPAFFDYQLGNCTTQSHLTSK